MKVDSVAQALRLGAALLLFSLTVAALYLVGAAQSFAESTLRELFLGLRWLCWAGLLISWLGILPVARHRARRVMAAIALGIGFALLFAFVLFWGSWVYPESGGTLW